MASFHRNEIVGGEKGGERERERERERELLFSYSCNRMATKSVSIFNPSRNTESFLFNPNFIILGFQKIWKNSGLLLNISHTLLNSYLTQILKS